MNSFIIDTGPLLALFNQNIPQHAWSRRFLEAYEPLITCEPVLTETAFLLRRDGYSADPVLAFLAKGILRCEFKIACEIDAIRKLTKKFEDVPMSIADACLVRLSEQIPNASIITFDSDFLRYRRNRNQIIPTIMP